MNAHHKFRLIALGLGFLCAVTVRADEVLSNLAEGTLSSAGIEATTWQANRFFTGDSAGGYSLDSVTISFDMTGFAGGNFFVGIYNNSGSVPGTQVGSNLSGPTNPPGNTDEVYTASGLHLNADTVYWVVTGVSSGGGFYNWNNTSSDSFTANGTWSLFASNSRTSSNTQGASWNALNSASQFKFGVSATAVPEPGAYAAVGGLLALVAVCLRKHRKN